MAIFSSLAIKIAGGAAAVGLASAPIIQSYSALADQSTRPVGSVSTSEGGVGGKKELKKPVEYRPAPQPVYVPPPPVAAPPPPPPPPAVPAEVAAAPVAAKKGSNGLILGVLGAAAVIGAVLLISDSDDDDDEPASP